MSDRARELLTEILGSTAITSERFERGVELIDKSLDEIKMEEFRAYRREAENAPYTYTSTQATNCAVCGEHKHTPLRVDIMGGYMCLTCINNRLHEFVDVEKIRADERERCAKAIDAQADLMVTELPKFALQAAAQCCRALK